jgi:hypothetical protein
VDADGTAVITYVEVDRGQPERPVLRSCLEVRDARGSFVTGATRTPDAGARTGLWGDVEGATDGSLYIADVFAGTVDKISSDGSPVRGWGSSVFRSSPRLVRSLVDPVSNLPGYYFGVTDLAAGDHHTCVLLDEPVIPPFVQIPPPEARRACWGNNGAQQLGRGYSLASVGPAADAATRFTLSTKPVGVSAPVGAGWNSSSSPLVGLLAPQGTESAAASPSAFIATTGPTVTARRLIGQAVSDPLPAQPLSGQISVAAPASYRTSISGRLLQVFVTGANSQLNVYLLKPNGSTETLATSLPGTATSQWTTQRLVRRFPLTSLTLPPGAQAQRGDRLVVEYGVRATVSAESDLDVRAGATFSVGVGGPSGPDDAGIEGAVPSGLPWVEFSDGLILGRPSQPATTSFAVFAPAGDGLGTGEKGVSVTAGADHTCVLGDQGGLSCMGDNGQQRYAADTPSETTERAVTLAGGNKPTVLAAGGQSTCIVIALGSAVWCFGSDASGQRGDSSAATCASPFGPGVVVRCLPQPDALYPTTALSVGSAHACAIADDLPYCWGSNTSHQVSPGTAQQVPYAQRVEFPATVASVPTLTRTMVWATRTAPDGGLMAVERRPGALVSATFDGSAVGWRTLVGPGHGKARVTIDGDVVATIDNKAATTSVRTRWFRGLGEGRHSIAIRVLESRRSDGTNRLVAMRGLALPDDSRATLPATSPALRYRWGPASPPPAIASDLAGARLDGAFSGRGLSVTRLVGSGQGDARLVIDGERTVLLRNTASGTPRATTVRVDGLRDSAHTLRLEVLGTSAGTGTGVTIVRLEATP